jgi:hypothetical protein
MDSNPALERVAMGLRVFLVVGCPSVRPYLKAADRWFLAVLRATGALHLRSARTPSEKLKTRTRLFLDIYRPSVLWWSNGLGPSRTHGTRREMSRGEESHR